MKILLTNHALEGVGGTEKWTHDMARILSEDHEVSVFTYMRGITSEKIEEFAEVTDDVKPGYDLVLMNHNPTIPHAQKAAAPIIRTCHGPKHGLEKPSWGADMYVGVSHEVKDSAPEFGMSVITNGVDLEQFQPTDSSREIPRVLSMCKSAGASWMLSDACKKLGFHYQWLHYTERPTWETAQAIAQADIVAGCGRTAIEALASGKEVLVFDGREDKALADGWITEANVEELRKKNFSCRTHRHSWDLNGLVDVLAQYAPSDWARGWSEINSDIRHKSGEYLTLHHTWKEHHGKKAIHA